MLAAGIVFGILLLLLLMAGMWLAFNMNDYGVNDWVDDEEEDNVAERNRNRESRLEARVEEVDHKTMQAERRRGGSEEVLEKVVRGREEVYCISKHSPSVSLDSAISVGSPLDSTGKTSIVSHRPSPNLYQNPPWQPSPSAFTLVFSSTEVSHPSTYPTPTSPHPPRSDHLTISLPPKSDIQAIRVVREVEEKPPRSPSQSTKTPDLCHKDSSATESKTVETSSPDPGMFSPPKPQPSIPKSSASPPAFPPASSPFASPSPSCLLDARATSSPPSTPASPHSAQISVLLESLPRKDFEQSAVTAWPENVPAKEDEQMGNIEEITLADRNPARPVSTSYKLESLKLAATRAAVAPTKG